MEFSGGGNGNPLLTDWDKALLAASGTETDQAETQGEWLYTNRAKIYTRLDKFAKHNLDGLSDHERDLLSVSEGHAQLKAGTAQERMEQQRGFKNGDGRAGSGHVGMQNMSADTHAEVFALAHTLDMESYPQRENRGFTTEEPVSLGYSRSAARKDKTSTRGSIAERKDVVRPVDFSLSKIARHVCGSSKDFGTGVGANGLHREGVCRANRVSECMAGEIHQVR